jgi:2,5-diketo-D-gluconate reductase A
MTFCRRDLIVISKSTHRERLEENAQIFDFDPSDDDITEMDGLDLTGRAVVHKWW